MARRRVDQGRVPHLWRWFEAHGQDREPVALAIGLSAPQMYRRVRGEKTFSLTQARAIAAFLRVPFEELFPGGEGVDARDLLAARVLDRDGRGAA